MKTTKNYITQSEQSKYQKIKIKIVERDKIDTTNTHMKVDIDVLLVDNPTVQHI